MGLGQSIHPRQLKANNARKPIVRKNSIIFQMLTLHPCFNPLNKFIYNTQKVIPRHVAFGPSLNTDDSKTWLDLHYFLLCGSVPTRVYIYKYAMFCKQTCNIHDIYIL